MSYHAGLAAEGQIAQDYARRGFAVARQRWRGKSGEIDLIVQNGDGLIFIEVKQSRNFDRAAAAVSSAQIRRLYRCAEEYLDTQPNGNLTDVRFDVALVNGHGETKIIENAFGHC
ncbi:YraN family protein [uncultured Sulfitobacter sp.]|uniref:YraN family protein n=1 Tax=uncultured Sulfitobacter sp. TaxID=191468 RepID=UPI00345472AD